MFHNNRIKQCHTVSLLTRTTAAVCENFNTREEFVRKEEMGQFKMPQRSRLVSQFFKKSGIETKIQIFKFSLGNMKIIK